MLPEFLGLVGTLEITVGTLWRIYGMIATGGNYSATYTDELICFPANPNDSWIIMDYRCQMIVDDH